MLSGTIPPRALVRKDTTPMASASAGSAIGQVLALNDPQAYFSLTVTNLGTDHIRTSM